MRTCDWCGKEVRFVLISETNSRRTWSTAMELTRRVVKNENGFEGLRVTEHFTLHACEEQAYAEQAVRANVAAKRGRMAEMMAAQAEYDLLVKAALTRICPSCKVGIGEACINLTKIKKGERVLTAGPHPKRLVFTGES